jgi:hypothetical protein
MNRATFVLLASLSVLGACGDNDPSVVTDETRSQAKEAIQSIDEAGRETGQALKSTAQDIGKAMAPVMNDAKEAGREALDATTQGVNSATRGLACQTSRAANDAAGIAANC